MQQSDFYSYLLDNPGRSQPQVDQSYYNSNSSSFQGLGSSSSSGATPTSGNIDKKVGDSSTSNNTTTAAVALKGGTDFRRRKNWSERILVEITGLLHVLSPTGKILYCSESTHELTGYRPHELVGQSLMDFLHVDDMDVFIRDFQMSFHTRSQIKTHYRFRRKDDVYIIFEVVGHPKSDIPGQPPQSFFGIAQPVPTKSGGLIDAFLELKAENNWLKKRIDELTLKYGKVDISSPQGDESHKSDTLDSATAVTTTTNTTTTTTTTTAGGDTYNNIPDDWMDTNNSSDLEDFISGYNKDDNTTAQESSERKDKWKRRKKHKGADEYVCADCGTTSSPEWRKGPHGPKTLCNACGLRWAKKNKKRDLNDD